MDIIRVEKIGNKVLRIINLNIIIINIIIFIIIILFNILYY